MARSRRCGATPRPMVDVFPSREALFHAAAERFVAAVERGVGESGRCAVALSGGATPTGLFQRLAADPFTGRIEWPRVQFFWSDERCVPPEHPDSNYRLARQVLLDHVPVPTRNVHRIRGEDEPRQAAAAYEQVLRMAFAASEGPPGTHPGSRFDLVLLGLGKDGHTASLFPGGMAVREDKRWVAAELVPSAQVWRVTLTPVIINAAAEVVFLVAGAEKAGVLRRVLREPSSPGVLPAQSIAPRPGTLRWMTDSAAAAEL